MSLALHFRDAPEPEATEARLIKLAQTLSPLPRLVRGKFVLNLTLADSPHKGAALKTLIKETNAESCFYIGDDVTDEDAFALEHRNLVSVRVGSSDQSKALFFVESQRDVDVVFSRLLRL